jgi:hypothetical protein
VRDVLELCGLELWKRLELGGLYEERVDEERVDVAWQLTIG